MPIAESDPDIITFAELDKGGDVSSELLLQQAEEELRFYLSECRRLQAMHAGPAPSYKPPGTLLSAVRRLDFSSANTDFAEAEFTSNSDAYLSMEQALELANDKMSKLESDNQELVRELQPLKSGVGAATANARVKDALERQAIEFGAQLNSASCKVDELNKDLASEIERCGLYRLRSESLAERLKTLEKELSIVRNRDNLNSRINDEFNRQLALLKEQVSAYGDLQK